ncbi:hypothetical protein ABZ470_38200 [Streptosporangium sp. NPDC020072]|uniref:hypothetical protein n=1 Tax=Streptosporangium sp. NPDC020072 TaxID=3154788 RepID=UPI0034453B7C
MSDNVAGVNFPPGWARLIDEAVTSSGRRASKIASCSMRVAKEFSKLDLSIEGHGFDASLLSRMRSGKGLQKPCFEKLIVLKLVLLCLSDHPGSIRDDARLGKMIAEAKFFAEQVWKAIEESREVNDPYHVMNARHERTVELFEAYGKGLLAQIGKGDGEGAEAKLALLHQLAGNGDDARYWSSRAQLTDLDYLPASSQSELFSRARHYAAEYHRASRVDVVRIYLEYAAGSGDGAAALLLGGMAELEEDSESAMKWYRDAESLGYSGGGPRAEGLG